MTAAADDPTASRPALDPSYDVAADEAGMVDWTWAREQLVGARNYWIASVRPDGRPHTAPVWGVWLGGALYLDTARRSRKALNLLNNAEVVAHTESGDETVVLEGRVEVVTDPADLRRFAAAYEGKYGWVLTSASAGESSAERIVFRLRPRVAFGWLERDFTRSAARWNFA